MACISYRTCADSPITRPAVYAGYDVTDVSGAVIVVESWETVADSVDRVTGTAVVTVNTVTDRELTAFPGMGGGTLTLTAAHTRSTVVTEILASTQVTHMDSTAAV